MARCATSLMKMSLNFHSVFNGSMSHRSKFFLLQTFFNVLPCVHSKKNLIGPKHFLSDYELGTIHKTCWQVKGKLINIHKLTCPCPTYAGGQGRSERTLNSVNVVCVWPLCKNRSHLIQLDKRIADIQINEF